MDPKQTNDNTVRKTGLTGYLVAGLAAIILMIAAFWGLNSIGATRPDSAPIQAKMAEERRVLTNELKLHWLFGKLQKLDNQYGSLILSNAPSSQTEELSARILATEALLNKTIDSMEKEADNYNVWANVVMIDSINSTFRMALDNRKYLSTLRNSMTGKQVTMNSSQKEFIDLKTELNMQNNLIASLENKLRMKTTEIGNGELFQSGKQKKASKNNPEAEIAQMEEQATQLLNINENLKTQNESLSAQLNGLRQSGSSEDALRLAARTRMSKMEEEIADLQAELNFARVDCSLSRADVKKIISNSRQRKELLADAMKTLQTLAGSGKTGVKLKARDKIRELNQIASAVRD